MTPSAWLVFVLVAIGCVLGLAFQMPLAGFLCGLAVSGALIWWLGEDS
jgi:hypothetical protein